MKRNRITSSVQLVTRNDGNVVELVGVLGIHTLADAESLLQNTEGKKVDLAGLTGLDTCGALFLCKLKKTAELINIRSEHDTLLKLVGGLDIKPMPKQEAIPGWRAHVASLGRLAVDAGRDTLEVITFVGRAMGVIGRAISHPGSLRMVSISRHIEETGIHALPIIGLMAIMISVVIGYQGVAQLRPYGAEQFTINLVAVSVLREMGVLVTAIMVAGRSGSAFAAEIGVMKAGEEIDALVVLGFEPMELLIVPRLIGLIIALPLLTVFADVMGLLGGAWIAGLTLHISPAEYLQHVKRAVDGSDLFVGLFKAPVFAFFIGVIGCLHGLKVRGSAESVGRETTAAVVQTIFVVLMLDAGFSVLFEQLGI